METTINTPQTLPQEIIMDHYPDFAIDPAEVEQRRQELADYRRDHMVAGLDYGEMPSKSGRSGKYLLFKAGAEKLAALYGLAPLIEVINRVEDWDRDFVSYEVKVSLVNKRTTRVDGEGIGSCNSREKQYLNKGGAETANTILKMAKKRAYVDAVLSATRSSGLFTQEEEAVPGEVTPLRSVGGGTPAYRAPAHHDQRPVSNGRPACGPNAASEPHTENQARAIVGILRSQLGSENINFNQAVLNYTGRSFADLTKAEASSLIDQLKAKDTHQQRRAA